MCDGELKQELHVKHILKYSRPVLMLFTWIASGKESDVQQLDLNFMAAKCGLSVEVVSECPLLIHKASFYKTLKSRSYFVYGVCSSISALSSQAPAGSSVYTEKGSLCRAPVDS